MAPIRGRRSLILQPPLPCFSSDSTGYSTSVRYAKGAEWEEVQGPLMTFQGRRLLRGSGSSQPQAFRGIRRANPAPAPTNLTAAELAEFPCECRICGKRFRNQKGLSGHMNVHTKEPKQPKQPKPSALPPSPPASPPASSCGQNWQPGDWLDYCDDKLTCLGLALGGGATYGPVPKPLVGSAHRLPVPEGVLKLNEFKYDYSRSFDYPTIPSPRRVISTSAWEPDQSPAIDELELKLGY